MEAGGISLQIAEVEIKMVLPQFLVEAKMKAVGNLDNTLNDERYNYLTLFQGVSTLWQQNASLKPIRFAESVINVADMLLVYPINPDDQAAIQLMPRYASQLNIHQTVITKAEQILINAQGKLNTAGKDPKGYIAASLYIACQQLGEHRSQKQIASVCNITEVTLRSRIKEFQKL